MKRLVARLWLPLVLTTLALPVYAVPGDILFSDDFESGALGPDWTVDNSGGGDAGVSTATANSGSNSMYTRWNQVSVTSTSIDASVPAAELSVWLRRGADAFSEDPEAADEDLVVEFRNSSGGWVELENFPGGGSPGEAVTRTYSLPGAALHLNLQLRFRQTGGDGGAPANGGVGWDYYHIDDVTITEVSPPVAGAGFCDDFESGLTRWTRTNVSRAGISNQTSNSPSNALYTRHGPVSVMSDLVDMSVAAGLVSLWIRRGDDSFSEDPDNNEDLVLEYRNDVGAWVALETFSGSGPGGAVFTRTYGLASDALHNQFQLRIRQTGGSGSDFDYWHIDDVCIQPASVQLYYAMDEAQWTGASNEVQDSSSEGNDGQAVGGGVTTAGVDPAISGDPGTCRYGEFPVNTDANIRQAVDTGLDMNTLGETGTISFWYKSNERWNGNRGDRMLFDASTTADGQKYFFLVLRNNSRLRFALEDSSDGDYILDSGNNNFRADEWVHVAVTWDLPGDSMQIFINGSLDNSSSPSTNGAFGELNTLYIGDNRSTYLASGASGNSANGSIDEFRVYNFVQSGAQITSDMNETHACGGLVDHFEIEHDGTALTCEPESVTVRACENSDCSSLYTSSVSVTLTPSGWVGGDTQSFTGGSGTFELRHTTPGTVTLGVDSSTPAATDSTQCLNTATGASSCELEYFDSGFSYSIPTQTSCATSGTVAIRAVRKDDTSQRCVPSFANRTETINLWSSYSDPASGSRQVILNNGSSDYTLATSSPGTGVPLDFDANGEASVTLSYDDAGQLTLNSSFSGSGAEAGLVMTGSDSFVVKPAKLYVFSDDANAACAGAAPTCSAFKRAGETFNLKVRAACADNSVTPNFQLSGLTLSHTNLAPALAQGTLNVSSFDIDAADNGEHTISTQSVSEVGAFTFTAALPPGGYFGETIGDSSLNTSAEIGRFHPDHFCLVSSALIDRTEGAPYTAAGCSDGFSYLDEDFSVQVTLKAQAQGISCTDASVTQNYDGAWSKFSSPFSEDYTDANEAGKWNLGAVDEPGAGASVLNGRIDPVASGAGGAFTAGQISFTLQQDIDRLGSAPDYTPQTPLSDVRLGINPLDTDNVAIDTTDLIIDGANYRQVGTTSLFFGRLFAENAFGSNDSAIPLRMYARSEYCNSLSGAVCDEWLHKTDDSCSLFSVTPPADTDLGHLSDGDGGGYYQRPSPAVSSDNYDFSAGSGRIHVPDSSDHSGGWQLFYTAGGDGGDYVIPFDAHGYLRTAPGTASFGLYRGDDRIIYWREVFE